MASNSSELGGLQEQREVIAAQGVRQEFVVGSYDLETSESCGSLNHH